MAWQAKASLGSLLACVFCRPLSQALIVGAMQPRLRDLQPTILTLCVSHRRRLSDEAQHSRLSPGPASDVRFGSASGFGASPYLAPQSCESVAYGHVGTLKSTCSPKSSRNGSVQHRAVPQCGSKPKRYGYTSRSHACGIHRYYFPCLSPL